MKPTILVSVIAVALLATVGVLWLQARDAPRELTQIQAPAPPPAPLLTQAADPAPSSERIQQQAREHNAQLGLEIERALVSRDPQLRETAFTFLLPELLRVEPARVTDMVARQEPGEARDALRDEVARQWITHDRDSAVQWMKSLDNPDERHASAQVAVQSLAAIAPGQAIELADQFNLGRDDGSLEHLVQIWAEDDLEQATRWLDSQPAGPRTEQMRARIEQVRTSRAAKDPPQPQ